MTASPLNSLAVLVRVPVIPESSGILPHPEKVILANLDRHSSIPPTIFDGRLWNAMRCQCRTCCEFIHSPVFMAFQAIL